MELHNLKPAPGSVKKDKRIGRGQGSTRGGTSTKGHKGAQSRAGYSSKRAFEGGQMPLQMRIPKRGFKNINRVSYVGFNLDAISAIAEKHNLSEFSVEILRELNIIQRNDKVKVLGRGELSKALTFKVHAYTAKAMEVIGQSGGRIQEN